MKHQRILNLAVLAGALLGASVAFGATPPPATASAPPAAMAPASPPAGGDTGVVKSDVPPALAKEAKITLDAARTTALAKVPGGTVRSEELEREHGKLIYSFDIAVSGKTGITEVNVSALSGKVLNVHRESAKTEKAEEHHAKPKPPHRAHRY